MAKAYADERTQALKEAPRREAPLVDPDVVWTPAARKPGSPARDRLLLAHAPLVKYLAHRIGARLAGPVDYDDLVGDGTIGLIEAVERFDPKREVRFKTYAESRIRGAILDGIRARDWAPRSLRRAGRKLDTAIAEAEARLGETASDEDIAAELSISIEELHSLYVQARGVRLSPLPGAEEEGQDPADPNESPHADAEEQERRQLLAHEIEGLPERERLVLSLYYERELTLREIGEVLEVTESRICQIHTRAVSRLRARIEERMKVPELVS